MRRWPMIACLLTLMTYSAHPAPVLQKIATLSEEAGSSPSGFVVIGDSAFFFADDGINGKRLWFSDGTPEGTQLVDPGLTGAIGYSTLCTGSDGYVYYLMVTGGTAYLRRANSATSEMLWSRAGSSGGYVVNYQGTIYFTDNSAKQVMRLESNGQTSLAITMKYQITGLYAAGDRLFIKTYGENFVSDDGMYVSDGTAAGTNQFDRFCPTSQIVTFGSNCAAFADYASSPADLVIYDPRRTSVYRIKGSINGMAVLNNKLLLSGTVGGLSGTHVVDDTAIDFTFQQISPSGFNWKRTAECAGSLYYTKASYNAPQALVRISSSYEVSTVKEFPLLPTAVNLDGLTASGDELRMLVTISGIQTLWKSVGSSDSIDQVAEIGCRTDNYYSITDPSIGMAAGDTKTYFTGDTFEGREPWVTDGTEQNTIQLANINKKASTESQIGGGEFVIRGKSGIQIVHNGYLQEVIDGQARRVQNLYPMLGVSWHTDIANGALWLMSDYMFTRSSYFLMAHHPGAGSLMRFTNLFPYGPSGSAAKKSTVMDGKFIYGASELMSYDGSGLDPVVLKDISPDGDSAPVFMGLLEGKAYFSADDGTLGRQIWETDGTGEGTVLFKNLGGPENVMSSTAATLISHRMMFFPATTAQHGEELWRINSSNGNTRMLVDINPGVTSSNPGDMLATAKGAAFLATTAEHGRALWHSDGTVIGTVLVKDFKPGTEDYPIAPLGSANGLAFYSVSVTTNQRELWRTDGTDAGTFSLGTYDMANQFGTIRYQTSTPKRIFYTVDGNSSLFCSNGLPGGTIDLGNVGSSRAVVGSTYYYIFGGSYLWKISDSDGAPSQVTTQAFGSPRLQADTQGVYILSTESTEQKAIYFYGTPYTAAIQWEGYQ